MNDSPAVFDELVLIALKRVLAGYRAHFHSAPRIAITITTATPLSVKPARLSDVVRHAGLPEHRCEVALRVDDTLAAPGYRIAVEPPLDRPAAGGPAPTAAGLAPTAAGLAPTAAGLAPTAAGFAPAAAGEPGPTVLGGGAAARPTGLVLTLRYGDWRWTYPLAAAGVWIPLGRGLVANGRLATIRLPDFLVAVPRGPLLVLRVGPDGAQLRRSAERAEYSVAVDGRPLPPDSVVPAGARGAIAYSAGSGASTSLAYELASELADEWARRD